jgi:membrane fusion protein, multidrug efflux system
MKKTTFLILGVTAAIALVFGGYQYKKQQSVAVAQAATTAQAAKPPPTIEFSASDLMKIKSGEINRSIPLTGSLKPVNQALIKSKIAGELKSFSLREGMSVKAGQVIAQIDAAEAQSRATEREAQLRSANAQAEQAKRNVENNKALLDKNFISQSAFDSTKSNYDVALANRDAIAQQLVQGRKSLNDTRIVSPIAGVIAERYVQPGEKLGVDSRVVLVMDLSRMEIEAAVPASDIAQVVLGQKIALKVEGVPGEQMGTVVRIAPSTQAGTRSIPIYIALENRNPQIRAGMFAQGGLAVEARKGAIIIPLSALKEVAGRSFVYLIENDKIAEREVKVGLRDDRTSASNGSSGIAEITAGLKLDDEIVAVNLGPLTIGATVQKIANGKKIGDL